MAHKAVDTDTRNKELLLIHETQYLVLRYSKAAFISTGLPADSAQYKHQGLKN